MAVELRCGHCQQVLAKATNDGLVLAHRKRGHLIRGNARLLIAALTSTCDQCHHVTSFDKP